MTGYARHVPFAEISDPANDYSLNIRRYVDNSPPPEPQDVRAHLVGGVPVAEVISQNPLFDALGFNLAHVFDARPSDAQYLDFTASLVDRMALRPLVENDSGVMERVERLRQALCAWWTAHASRLAELPAQRNLNAARTEFLETFVAALTPLGLLDRFKLAGVIASWLGGAFIDNTVSQPERSSAGLRPFKLTRTSAHSYILAAMTGGAGDVVRRPLYHYTRSSIRKGRPIELTASDTANKIAKRTADF